MALILSRRTGERLMIGDEITATVLGVRGNQVKVGIQAPDDVLILREELLDKPHVEEDNKHDDARRIIGKSTAKR